MVPTSITVLCFFPICTYKIIGSLLRSVDKGKLNLTLIYRWFCMTCRHYPKVNSYSTTVHLWDIPGEQRWREILPVAITSSNVPWCLFIFIFLNGRMARCVILYQFIDWGPWFGWMARDLGKKYDRKIRNKKDKVLWEVTSLTGQKIMKIFCPM